jgi:pimeloyl-ACP methyl ester carboxylesterase
MARFENLTGKYIHLDVQGVEYRVYFEEAGQGIPLVCQHTAGSDGRQWRHLLNDREITSKYRVIAFDLPYHGKSLPPESVEWWKTEYKLTKSFFLDFHAEFCKALSLKKPVYIGCSMGGFLAPDLALERPELYCTIIGVEAGMGFGARPDARASEFDLWHHPRISDDFKAAAMYCVSAPASPEKYRHETAWEYSANAPSVFKGDINYYIIEHDLNNGRAREIDTSRVAMYFLTGEYDAGCSPADTLKLAEQIKGAHFTEMKGLGHFGMCENYELFRKYLIPVLDEIGAQR